VLGENVIVFQIGDLHFFRVSLACIGYGSDKLALSRIRVRLEYIGKRLYRCRF